MHMNDDQAASAAGLRRRAEARLKEKVAAVGQTSTEADLRRIQHEFEVYQIELEMQNEELPQAQAANAAALEKYTDLYDFAPVGYFTFGGDGAILTVNLAGARIVGIERARLMNRRFGLLVSEADRPTFNAFLEKTFAGKERECCEVALLKEESEPLSVRVEAVVSDDGHACRAAVLDITARRQAEAERERLIQELQSALDRVKLLSGLLPICASCKKIRDDHGAWKHIELYVSSHSEATFTHGMCPDCIPKFSLER
jgi:PAS domain S-box-containing protein